MGSGPGDELTRRPKGLEVLGLFVFFCGFRTRFSHLVCGDADFSGKIPQKNRGLQLKPGGSFPAAGPGWADARPALAGRLRSGAPRDLRQLRAVAPQRGATGTGRCAEQKT